MNDNNERTPPTLYATPSADIDHITIDGVDIYQGQTGHFERIDGKWVLVEMLTAEQEQS